MAPVPPPGTPATPATPPATTLSTDRDAEGVTRFPNNSDKASDALKEFTGTGLNAKSVFSSFHEMFNKINESLSKNTGLMTNSTAGVSLFTTAIIGTRKSFTDFSGELNGFEGQITPVLKGLDNIFGTNETGKASVFGQLLGEVFGKKVPEGIGKSAAAIKLFIIETAQSADNMSRLQNTLVKMSSESGGLDNFLNKAGAGFQNMNSVLALYADQNDKIAQSSGESIGTVEKYFAQLAQVPKALDSLVTSSSHSTKNTSMLDATMKLAKGSGRDFSEVIDTLKVAYKNMGVEGENALKFTARIGEIANKNGIEYSVVRDALRNTTDQLKAFGGENLSNGKIMEGSIRIMNNYVGALKLTGVSGATAIGVVQQMTSTILGLDVAQRSFLSQQSGGPGGLRGAFKVERMIREGNMDQVMKDVENTLKKQFGGRIISNKEAESSEDLASKAIMQRQMLQQGPLGAFAKDEQSAARILEAMSTKGKGEPLSNEVLKEVMTKGEQLQQTTNTILNDMLGIMNEARRISDTSNHGFAQTMFAARTGTNDFKSKAAGDIQPAEEESRTNLKQLATDAATKSGDRVRQISNIGKASASEVPVTQNLTADLGRHVGKFGKDAEIALPGMVARIEGMFKSGHVGEARAQAEMYEARIKQAREDSKKIKDPNQKKLEVQKIEDESQKLDLLKQRINQQVEGGMPGKREYVAPADYSATESPLKDALSRLPTDKIGDATKSSIRAAEVAAKTEQEEESSSSGQLATNKRVDVHVETTFEGICIYCRSSMDKKNAHSRGGIANA